MTDTYTQLFTSYAHDLTCRLKKSEEEALDQLTRSIPMSNEHRVDVADQLSALRKLCCAESFALGIQVGLRITQELGGFSTTAS